MAHYKPRRADTKPKRCDFGSKREDLGFFDLIYGQKTSTHPSCVVSRVLKMIKVIKVQLNPALMDFRGPIIFFCYKQTYVIANKGSKRN